jgi:hypothetical protein
MKTNKKLDRSQKYMISWTLRYREMCRIVIQNTQDKTIWHNFVELTGQLNHKPRSHTNTIIIDALKYALEKEQS